MANGSTDSPAALYAPVSLTLGIVSVVATVLGGYVGIAFPLLTGSLAVTFAVFGLVRGISRSRCAAGLVGGAVGVLYPLILFTMLSA